MIALIDYGSGNIHAIANIYKRLNIPFIITSSYDVLKSADKLILPGVGDFDETMKLFKKKGLKTVLDNLVLELEKPILGVCVGMQVMGTNSEEGSEEGFGWVEGEVKKFDSSILNQKPYLPHMGWNTIVPVKSTPLFENYDSELGFYFLHNYHFVCANNNDILSTSNYGREFASSINSGNVYGCQFHPEKSHQNGIAIFRNFAKI